eukprot:TRINITY_DN2026_c0_g1_i1.p1 TRINITY_DN2026_c0_g1~~TRINITY_DN2026_c0_g1_i1.p1  ORF type:complete len:448 (+),score=96.27 TRINITY_DN2026_c0_g1_i1:22-1344(+)
MERSNSLSLCREPVKDDRERGAGRLEQLDREMTVLKDAFAKIIRIVEEERAYVELEHGRLDQERMAFDSMRKRVEDVNRMRQSKVKLNIGGALFDTSAETLTCEKGSMLEAMFSGRFKIEKDEDGSSFIDRDPACFPLVLNYLRDRRDGVKPKTLTIDAETADKVLKEAKFYGLDGLEKLIITSTSLVVSQHGASKYTSIGAALRDAKNGDRILVQPGTYFESLMIDKTVDIVGEGNPQEILLFYSGDHVVTSMTEKGSLRNISISQQGDEYHCLFITKGCLVVEDCEFQSCGWACVGISGEKTHPILRGNKIRSSSDNGIIILSKGKGIIEGNEIYGYTLQGIEIREESNPVIRGNKIHDGKDSGIYINTKGRGLIENNEIYNNDFNGIAIKFEGQPKKVRHNRIFNNKQRGIYSSGDSKAEIEENEVFGNGAGDIVEE